MTDEMRAFAEKYGISLTDPDLKRIYDLEMSAKRDWASALYNAKNEGIELGMQNAVKGMAAKGLSSDFIAQCLKMSQEMVEEILAKEIK